MKRVAIVGIVGVPAQYGGFETMVENIIGDNASNEIEYTIFCSSKDCHTTPDSYKEAKLRYIALHANGVQSIIYDGVSLLRSIRGYDVVVALGVSGGIFFPIFKLLTRSRFIVNIDGVEWKRDKWGAVARSILRLSERLAIRYADVIIADNQGIVDHVASEYKKTCELIAYGGDHVLRDVSDVEIESTLSKYGLKTQDYAISICRIEPENSCDKILKAFAKSKTTLIVIGNWLKSDYGRGLKSTYSTMPNIKIIDAIYDLDTLYILRSQSKYYIHGHSAGGTNPSLVEAMYCSCNIIAYDVIYNRATTENKAHYFKNRAELISLLCSDKLSDNSQKMSEIAHRRYRWEIIAHQYETLYYF